LSISIATFTIGVNVNPTVPKRKWQFNPKLKMLLSIFASVKPSTFSSPYWPHARQLLLPKPTGENNRITPFIIPLLCAQLLALFGYFNSAVKVCSKSGSLRFEMRKSVTGQRALQRAPVSGDI
jgi:hypothetical protein